MVGFERRRGGNLGLVGVAIEVAAPVVVSNRISER
jgi:hypothetical protein